MNSLKAATDVLHVTLLAAAEQREQRPDLRDGPDGPECEWTAYERAQMCEKINEIRTDRGLPSVTENDVVRVERLAVGHSDYSRKFAFYCAELALQPKRP